MQLLRCLPGTTFPNFNYSTCLLAGTWIAAAVDIGLHFDTFVITCPKSSHRIPDLSPVNRLHKITIVKTIYHAVWITVIAWTRLDVRIWEWTGRFDDVWSPAITRPMIYYLLQSVTTEVIQFPDDLCFHFIKNQWPRTLARFSRWTLKYLFRTALLVGVKLAVALAATVAQRWISIDVLLATIALVWSLGRTLFLAILSRCISEPHPQSTPLPDGESRERGQELCQRTGFPLDAVLVEENEAGKTGYGMSGPCLVGFPSRQFAMSVLSTPGTRKSLSPNDSQIIPQSTIDTYPHNEVLAILAHEIGHWKYNHLARIYLLDSPVPLIILGFLAFEHSTPALQSAGIDPTLQSIPLTLLVWNMYSRLTCMLQPLWSLYINARKHREEYQAGKPIEYSFFLTRSRTLRSTHAFATSLDLGSDQIAFLQRNDSGLGLVSTGWLMGVLTSTHPRRSERIETVQRAIDKSE